MLIDGLLHWGVSDEVERGSAKLGKEIGNGRSHLKVVVKNGVIYKNTLGK